MKHIYKAPEKTRLHQYNSDEVILYNDLVLDVAKKLELYPDQVKDILNTFWDIVRNYMLDADEGHKMQICINPSILALVTCVPKHMLHSNIYNTDIPVEDALSLKIRPSIRYRRDLSSDYRQNKGIIDAWKKEYFKEHDEKVKEKIEKERRMEMYGEDDSDY